MTQTAETSVKALPKLTRINLQACCHPALHPVVCWSAAKIFFLIFLLKQPGSTIMPEKIDAPMSPLRSQVQLTRRAARELAQISAAQRNQILLNAAQQLELRSSEILEANQRD